MADKFFAVSRIKHGIDHTKEDDPTYSRHETKWFEVGDEVTGLPKEEMQRLWDAGALDRRSSEDAKSEAPPETPPAPPPSSNKPPAPRGK